MAPKLVITPRPLSAAAFRPFGEVIEHAGSEPRRIIECAFESDGLAPERQLWVYRLSEPGQLPLQVTAMERHPHSAQMFSPLSCRNYLVAVCPGLKSGEPDIDALSVFIARSGQGIVYRRNVWHHPMVALGGPAEFVVFQAKGSADDTVWATIDRHVTIDARSEQSS
jgi:ureidoglycolate lyase